MSYRITELDPYLRPYEEHIENLMKAYHAKKRELVGNGRLVDFANAHLYFGIHPTEDGWVYREWLPVRRPCSSRAISTAGTSPLPL